MSVELARIAYLEQRVAILTVERNSAHEVLGVTEIRLADLTARNLDLLDELDRLRERVAACCNQDYREECMRLRAETTRQQRIIDTCIERLLASGPTP